MNSIPLKIILIQTVLYDLWHCTYFCLFTQLYFRDCTVYLYISGAVYPLGISKFILIILQVCFAKSLNVC
jgi:hypothetical protein